MSTCSATWTARSAGCNAGAKDSTAGAAAPLTAAAGTVCGATVRSGSGPWIRASSSSDPPQRMRVTVRDEAAAAPIAVTLAANGRSRRAAKCASTSLPRFVPAATTAVGASRSIRSSMQRAQAPGA